MGKRLTPDLKEAERFLNLLESGGHFWFQTLLEPKPHNGHGMPRVLNGTFAKCADQLASINLDGSAVWVQINAGTGRRNTDIDRVRAYFIDQDHGASELLFSSPQPLDIVVESSPGKHHGYWLTRDVPLKAYADRMRALANRFQGDHAVCHLSRVMRLPGFIHQKREPFLSRIVQVRDGI